MAAVAVGLVAGVITLAARRAEPIDLRVPEAGAAQAAARERERAGRR